MKLLRRGNRGEDVRNVQLALTVLGYNTAGTKGIFGDVTLRAVKNFQKDNGLIPDGIVGDKTREVLFGKDTILETKVVEDGVSDKAVMKVSNIDIIKHFEGLYLEAYLCPANVLTIGYGHVKDVYEGMVITEEQAEEYLREDLAWCEDVVCAKVSTPLEQHEFDALIALVFNIGSGAFSKSTLLEKLNSGDKEGAAKEFKRWNKVNKKPVAGLTRRRKSEEHLFSTGEVNFFD